MMRVVGIGAGGHAKVVIDILRLMGGHEIVGLLDADKALWGTDVLGVRVLGDDSFLPQLYEQGIREAFIGVGSVGNPGVRVGVYENARKHGFRIVSAIHPNAVVSTSAQIGEGATVMAGAVINADARLGDNVIVNTGAIVEHDCVIGNHAHISVNATLAGAAKVGERVHVGAGAIVKQCITVGERAVIAMGAVVVNNVEAGATVQGTPAVRVD